MKAVITDYYYESLEQEKKVFSDSGIELEAYQCKTEEEVM